MVARVITRVVATFTVGKAVCVASFCAAGVVALAALGCRDTPAAFGPDPVAARTRASELLEAFAANHTLVTRTAVLAASRHKLVNAALVPSRVYGDPTVWTAVRPDSMRILTASGHLVGDHYLLGEVVEPARPDRLGDQRHVVQLTRVGSHDFEWGTSVDLAVGSLTPDDVDRVVAALLATAASTPSQAATGIRNDLPSSGRSARPSFLARHSADDSRQRRLGVGHARLWTSP